MKYLWTLFCFGLLAAGPARAEWTIAEIPSPAGAGSAQPNLFVHDNTVYLSWQKSGPDGAAMLKFARLFPSEEPAWSAPRHIASGENWFVNWADIPSLVAFDENHLAAHWLAKSGEGTYAYDVIVAQSFDGGETWGTPVRPHTDGSQTEHGFVSMLPYGDQLLLTWLDGRKTADSGGHDSGHEGPMTLRAAMMDGDGTLSGEVELDDLTCSCCPTALVETADGMVVAYRDRSTEEIRDIYMVRFDGSAWSKPAPVATDNWKIPGCPVNGPALDAEGQTVVAAWFTAPGNETQVNVAFSTDGGRSFDAPVRVDGGSPVGRADAVLLADGSAVVSWVETNDDGAEIRVRTVTPAGGMGSPQKVTATSAKRSSGFPRMVRVGKDLYMAWVDVSGEPIVKTARLQRKTEG